MPADWLDDATNPSGADLGQAKLEDDPKINAVVKIHNETCDFNFTLATFLINNRYEADVAAKESQLYPDN